MNAPETNRISTTSYVQEILCGIPIDVLFIAFLARYESFWGTTVTARTAHTVMMSVAFGAPGGTGAGTTGFGGGASTAGTGMCKLPLC